MSLEFYADFKSTLAATRESKHKENGVRDQETSFFTNLSNRINKLWMEFKNISFFNPSNPISNSSLQVIDIPTRAQNTFLIAPSDDVEPIPAPMDDILILAPPDDVEPIPVPSANIHSLQLITHIPTQVQNVPFILSPSTNIDSLPKEVLEYMLSYMTELEDIENCGKVSKNFYKGLLLAKAASKAERIRIAEGIKKGLETLKNAMSSGKSELYDHMIIHLNSEEIVNSFFASFQKLLTENNIDTNSKKFGKYCNLAIQSIRSMYSNPDSLQRYKIGESLLFFRKNLIDYMANEYAKSTHEPPNLKIFKEKIDQMKNCVDISNYLKDQEDFKSRECQHISGRYYWFKIDINRILKDALYAKYSIKQMSEIINYVCSNGNASIL